MQVRLGVDKLSRICDVNPNCVLRLLIRVLNSGETLAQSTQVDALIQNKTLLDGLRSLIVRGNPAAFESILEPASLLDTPSSLQRRYRTCGIGTGNICI